MPRLRQFKFVGFTGHRDLADPAVARAGIAAALERVQSGRGGDAAEWVAVSSAAAGADAIFAELVIAADLAWQAVLPLPLHVFRQDFGADAWPAVEALLARAEEVVIMPATVERNEAYLDAGLETVDRSDVLVALWDGAPSRGRGGTADVVAYARELRRPIVIVHAQTGAITTERLELLAAEDPLMAEINALPPVPGYASAEGSSAEKPAALIEFWRKADESATGGAPHFRKMVGGTVILHVLATLVAVTGVVFHLHWLGLPWIKLVCLLGALAVAMVLARSHAHHLWLRHRIAAEVCRSALGAWGLNSEMRFFASIHVPELQALLRTIRQLHLRQRRRPSAGLDGWKDSYLVARIERQASYFRRQEMKAAPLLRRLKLGFWVATWAAIICTAGYTVAATLHLTADVPGAEVWFYLLPIGLPVIAAGCMSFVAINDLQRRVARYREMQALLDRSRRQLSSAHSWHAVSKVVTTTEEGLLHEVVEWHAIARYTESH